MNVPLLSINLAIRCRSSWLSTLIGLTALSLWIVGTSGISRAALTPPAADPAATVTTRIVPGCVLGIDVTDEPQLIGSYTVDADGKVHFKLTDDSGGNKEEWAVVVKDKRTDEAVKAISESLKKYLKNPQVRVVIARLARLHVEVSGSAVGKSGPQDLPIDARLSNAILTSGLLPNADLAHVRIERQQPADPKSPEAGAKPRLIEVDYAAFLRGDSDTDPELVSGDKIFIQKQPEPKPEPELKLVHIYGEVMREAGLPLSPGMTVKDAFERAGGFKPNADPERVYLVRGADGKSFELNADRVQASDPVHNLPLQAGDTIIVGKRDKSQRYAILGEVRLPKVFDWNPQNKVTLLTALEQAGGTTNNADRHKGVLRKGYLLDPTQPRDIAFDLDKILKHQQPDWDLEPGDAVFILPRQHRPSIFEQFLPLLFHFLPFGI